MHPVTPVRRTYVELYVAIDKKAANSVREVASRTVASGDFPDDIVYVIFYDVIEAVVEDGETTHVLKSEKLFVSGRHFIGGQIHTAEEIRKQRGPERGASIVSQLGASKQAVLTRFDTYVLHESGDTTVPL